MATTTEVEDLERPSKAVSTRVRYGILGVIVVATAINYMDRANLSIVAPDVKKDLNISAAELGLIFSAFSWTYAALQIPGGWVLDRVGPRITFGIALIFWSIVTGSISLAKGFTSLLGLRLILGSEVSQMIRNLHNSHEYDLPRAKVFLFPTPRPNELLCNCTRIIGRDGRELKSASGGRHHRSRNRGA